MDNVLPVVKERLFKTQTSEESMEDIADAENISPSDKPKSVQSSNQQLPTDIIFYCDKKYISLPANIEGVIFFCFLQKVLITNYLINNFFLDCFYSCRFCNRL